MNIGKEIQTKKSHYQKAAKFMVDFKKQKEGRDKCSEEVVQSPHPKKIIVSGPGTGKTYMFSKVLEKKKGNCLVLTFINNLVEELKEDLHHKAKVSTFHAYCKGLLHKIDRPGINDNFIFSPNLNLVISSDSSVIDEWKPHFQRSFYNLDKQSCEIPFFIKRANYYNAVSFNDTVYRVLKYFEENPRKIPEYEQVLVDEFQDFNRLEVEFIDILASKSPILIVGDDDQALYGKLKSASPQYIRDKYCDSDYASFDLPYCSRCPKVIIDALNDVLGQANELGKLQERVDKKYVCYLPEKEEDSKHYPKITHVHCTVQHKNAPYISRFIDQEIKALDNSEIQSANQDSKFTILITGPKHYLPRINSYLEQSGQYEIHYTQKDQQRRSLELVQGYEILLVHGKRSNLGWRVIMERDQLEKQDEVLKEIVQDEHDLYPLLPDDYIQKHLNIMRLVEKISKSTELSKSEIAEVEQHFGINIEKLKKQFSPKEKPEPQDEKEDKKISIKLSTYVGSKGLSAGFVFVLGLNNGTLPKSARNPSDIDICKFIVTLTRTVKKCYLISNTRYEGRKEGKNSIFLNWINDKRIQHIYVDSNYWS